MRNPELRSPAEWAEDLRVSAIENEGFETICAWEASRADCRELADRMDDLTEALRLLREYHEGGLIVLPRHEEASELLAKYEAKED